MISAAVLGHGLAAGTMLVWGTTFISTKVLLDSFTPLEILFSRFIIGFLALCLLLPRRLPLHLWREERWFIGAGLTGVTLYFLGENIALNHTTASNVGVIVGSVQFFIAIPDRLCGSRRPLHLSYFAGFIFALTGIALLSFNSSEISFNPAGDLLALGASAVWGIYTLCMRRIGAMGCNMGLATRRVFGYGLLGMLPFMYFLDVSFKPACYLDPVNAANLLFLGFGASALCFFTWNFAVKLIGPVQSGPYLYAAPAVTVTAAVLILGEKLTLQICCGIVLTMLGLLISELPHLKAWLKLQGERQGTKEKG